MTRLPLAAWLVLLAGCEREPAAPRVPPTADAPAPAVDRERRTLLEPATCEVDAVTPCGEYCDEHQVAEADCQECLRRAAAGDAASPSPSQSTPADPTR